jgi:hypothetical protein
MSPDFDESLDGMPAEPSANSKIYRRKGKIRNWLRFAKARNPKAVLCILCVKLRELWCARPSLADLVR